MKGYKIPKGFVEGYRNAIELYPKDSQYAWGMNAVVEALEVYPLEELDENPWHTGTPTEEGDYLVAFRMSDNSVEYGWCNWNNGAWDILCDYDPDTYTIVAWMPIPPYKEKEDGIQTNL